MSKSAQSIWDELTKVRDQLTGCGLILTIGWFSTVGFLFWLNDYSFYTLSANELGDFLAGSVAPVAFFWIVIGYLQQGKELSISSKALQAQEKELINQTEQLAIQSELTQKDIKLKLHEATPRLTYKGIHKREEVRLNNNIGYDLYFYNNGGKAVGAKFSSPEKKISLQIYDVSINGDYTPSDSIKKDHQTVVGIDFNKTEVTNFSIELTYFDVFGKKYRHHCPFYPADAEWPNFFENPVEIKDPPE